MPNGNGDRAETQVTTLLAVGLPEAGGEGLRALLAKAGLELRLRRAGNVSDALALARTDESLACVLMSRDAPGFEREYLDTFARSWDRPVPLPVVVVYPDDRASTEDLHEAWGMLRQDRLSTPEAAFVVRSAIEMVQTKLQLAALETRLEAAAGSDRDASAGIAGLAGRDRFRRQLEESIQCSGSEMTGAMLIGLDGFKAVNRSFGHEFGDEVLAMVAGRLRHCVRNADMLARWGGDEFSVILEQLARPDDAVFVAQRVLYAFSRPFVHGGHEIFLTPSIGIAIHPAHGDDARTLLQHADRAVYRTKRLGGNGYHIYSAQMDADMVERIATEGRLRSALKRHEYSLHYQPQVDARDGRIVGLEALLRWNDPVRGLRPPVDFIPILEQTGMIVPVGEWVIRKACTQARAWQFAGLSDLRVAVNLSPKQFKEAGLVEKVESILGETGLAPQCLELELTESVLMEDMPYAGSVMAKLKDMGVLIALDDFGTGYSALAVLKELPVDTLKIDRAFIRDIESRQDDRSICSAIVTLGRDLRLHVLAEGVETETQVEILGAQGCHLVQGFLYARPMPADDVWEWLVRRGSGNGKGKGKGEGEVSAVEPADEAQSDEARGRAG